MSVVKVIGLGKTYLLKGKDKSVLHAVKNATFELNEGESVGIIGRNGAGKSTLLKLLAGVTLPTSGEAFITGSFSSLLEVGTGFHPDLSGRDNIFLNASILGVSKHETSLELANIIAFSGVEKFIDQPIRTYSSGMKLRLAFAIIAHLKTDIIALDEVLAVGDSMFQIKCMERIFEFKKQGRTILFVSHNLSAINKLCERTLVLESGSIVFDGPTDEALKLYADLTNSQSGQVVSKYLTDLEIGGTKSEGTVLFSLKNLPTNAALDLGINIGTSDGISLYHFSNRFINCDITPEDSTAKIEVKFEHQLKPGNYSISIYIGQNEQQLEWLSNAASFLVPAFNPHGFHNPDSIQGPIISNFSISQS